MDISKITSKEQAVGFLNQFDNFLFDCDGVIWSGNTLLPKTIEILTYLKMELHKNLIFVSNNSTKSREEYLKKFRKLGINFINKNEIFNSSFASAIYIEKILNVNKETDKVFVIGMRGIEGELREAGIKYIGGEDIRLDDKFSVEESEYFQNLDPSVKVVLAGLDLNINYHRLAIGLQYLLRPEVFFVSTNIDSTFPNGKFKLPGAGTMIKALETCSNRKSISCGKPNLNMMKSIIKEHNIDISRSVMVGDRLNTDIKFGKLGGLSTLLVLSGICSEEDVFSKDNDVVPNYYINKLGDLYELIHE
ncbi:4-nitrophenylphosphatase [Ascoidea rubescens DSM 1968]|uniref:4-nitrophenylphosphatase n=1 Tax=Ascoidea rubescens DSM 1968 TaxID=1344418 RepID=A0A1D2VBI8_9ASCO|nr:2-phosphoglycolate phosphatase [Ascoidea rubescens DSM 1968]ODV59054.1 2-phosphoglycolate phosphatase [Ascoidea rubescens DSM 1968]